MTKKKAILLLVVTLVLGGFLAVYMKRAELTDRVNQWRADGLVAESVEAGEAGNWEESERLAEAAWQLRPGSIENLRQWFAASKRSGSHYLLSLAQAVFQHEEATPEDRRELIGLYLAIGDRVTFTRLVGEMSEEERMHPEALDLQARFLLSDNRPGQALMVTRELRKLRDEKADLLLLASALVRTPSEENKNLDEAQEIVDQLFQWGEEPEIALAAFSILAQIPSELLQMDRFADATDRLKEIEKSSEVFPSLWLLDSSRRILAEPGREEAIIEETIDRWIEEKPLLLGHWLLRQRQEDRLLAEIATAQKGEEDPEYYALRVQGFFQKGDLVSVQKLLANPHPDADQVRILSYRAALTADEGNEEAAQLLWEKALDQATEEHGRDALMALAQLAGDSQPEIRNRAVAEALKRPAAVSTPLVEVPFIFAHLAEEDSFDDMFEVNKNLFLADPENPVLVNNMAWLSLIHGSFDSYSFLPKLEKIVKDFPDQSAFRSTLILAYLKLRDVNAAVEAAVPLLAYEEKSTGDLAVLALLKAAQEDEPAAQALLAQANWRDMMTRERMYFQRALREQGVNASIPATLPW